MQNLVLNGTKNKLSFGNLSFLNVNIMRLSEFVSITIHTRILDKLLMIMLIGKKLENKKLYIKLKSLINAKTICTKS